MDHFLPLFGEYNRDRDPRRRSNYSFLHLIWWKNDLSNQPRQWSSSGDKRPAREEAERLYICVFRFKWGCCDKGSINNKKRDMDSFIRAHNIFKLLISSLLRAAILYNQNIPGSLTLLQYILQKALSMESHIYGSS